MKPWCQANVDALYTVGPVKDLKTGRCINGETGRFCLAVINICNACGVFCRKVIYNRNLAQGKCKTPGSEFNALFLIYHIHVNIC